MSLHIVVCVKSTPTTVNVSIDEPAGKIKTAGLSYAVNPFDEYAIEEAVRIKEKNPGSTVTALSLGAEHAEAALREAIARGCDKAVWLNIPECDTHNSYGTSHALAQALKKIHAETPVHLVLFGKNASDGNAGVTAAQIAGWLNWPAAISVKKIDSINSSEAIVWRAVENGVDVLRLKLPACVGTIKEINEPRLPSLKGKMASKKAVIPKWTAQDIGLKAEDFSSSLEPLKIEKFSAPPPRPAGLKIEGSSAAEKAKQLVDILIERKLV
jgi:electron transfer flavoprotein beta subunit